MATRANRADKPLPAAPDTERIVLGAILVDPEAAPAMRNTLTAEDFSLQVHRMIWVAMTEIHDSGENIDWVTLGERLRDRGHLESIGGLTYLASLTDGMPRIPNLDSYVGILHEKATIRRLMLLSMNVMGRCGLGEETAAELRDALVTGATALNAAPDGTGPLSSTALIAKFGIDTLLSPRPENEGIRLPWYRLQEALCGLQGGQMIILGAYTGRGKTSMALQIALHATRQHVCPYYVTTEMPPQQLFRRLVTQMSGVDGDRARHGELTSRERERQREQVAWLNEHPVWFDSRSRTVPAVLAGIRQAQAKAQIGLVVIDHVQHLQSISRFDSRAREVGHVSRSLKLAAMEFDLPFLVLSQFSRPNSDADAGLHSLKESGDLENDADVCLILNGPDLARVPEIPMRLKVAKQREGPAGFEIPMVFSPSRQAFASPGTEGTEA